ncbi:MAG: primosomal protein N', partial [Gemmatimonadaceae bacterium]|nr:primosomal protein N' [Gemmatimonadaceae bacterium]
MARRAEAEVSGPLPVATAAADDGRVMAAPGDIVDVVVNAGQPARHAFSYSVPLGMTLQPGQAVFVPFGAKVLQGIVLGPAGETPESGLRDIAAIADERVLLDPAHVALARWMSATYLAPLWECVSTCLPAGFGQRPVTMVTPVDVPPLLPVDRTDQRILAYLAEHGRTALDVLREAAGTVTIARLSRLQEQGMLTVAQGLARPRGHERFERRIALAGGPAEARAAVERLRAANPRSIEARLLEALADAGEITLTGARELGVTPRHVARLVAEALVEERAVQVDRDPIAGRSFASRGTPVLSPEQAAAANVVGARDGTTLLHGVTGSGKTEVYITLVQETLEAGRGAIILVPEISLTPQAIRRYGERFGTTIAVIHSGLSDGELYDTWFRVHEGRARVVLGSRSALFAPVNDLGLIVIDEEHEPSYKQSDPQPRYHARAAAEELARMTGARVVLGSATPDITTFHRAERGEIGYAVLEQRLAPAPGGGFTEAVLPQVQIVDMREELKAGNRHVFSRALVRAAGAALRSGEQVLLFVNRRGSARFILCRDCGNVAECPSCGTPMSLQADDGELPRTVCHNCGRTRRLDATCPRCGSTRYRPFGAGTQRIEMEARRAFPHARVARWDSQTAARKGAHDALVRGLEERSIDVVVGTQVLAKGLDLAGLTVVGVVDADVGLNLPMYSAPERTFQLVSQVIGRAGRRDRQGIAIIQTYSPEAPALQAAATGDYRAFFEHELPHRRRAGYPPFARLARLTFHHPDEEHGLEEASRVGTELRARRDAAGRAEPEVLGPSPAYIRRLRGEYRWQLLLRGHAPARL